MNKEATLAMMVNLGCKEPKLLLDDRQGYIISSSLINLTVSVSVDLLYPNDSVFIIRTKDKLENYSCDFKIKYSRRHNNSISNWIVKGMIEAKDLDMKLQLLQFKDNSINIIKNSIISSL